VESGSGINSSTGFGFSNSLLLVFGIANAKLSLSFSAKESNQRKLPAAPASLKVSA